MVQNIQFHSGKYVIGLARGVSQHPRAERRQVLVTEPLAQRPCRGSFGTAMAWWREISEPDGTRVWFVVDRTIRLGPFGGGVGTLEVRK
ncbi:MAG: hypothetical protein FJ295_20460 [Planctomycetes bacterium]|nr:hypothetical protein [Planctomycetota bacterium]